MSTTAISGNPAGQDPESEYGQDTVKVFSHEGDGENTEHLNSMDLNDVKTELERDAEEAEVSVFSIIGHCIQSRVLTLIFGPGRSCMLAVNTFLPV